MGARPSPTAGNAAGETFRPGDTWKKQGQGRVEFPLPLGGGQREGHLGHTSSADLTSPVRQDHPPSCRWVLGMRCAESSASTG